MLSPLEIYLILQADRFIWLFGSVTAALVVLMFILAMSWYLHADFDRLKKYGVRMFCAVVIFFGITMIIPSTKSLLVTQGVTTISAMAEEGKVALDASMATTLDLILETYRSDNPEIFEDK